MWLQLRRRRYNGGPGRQETPGRLGRQLGWLPASARLVDTRRKAAKEQRRRESRRRLTRLIIGGTRRGAISPESAPGLNTLDGR